MIIADYDHQRVERIIPIPEGVGSTFDVSADGRYLVTGYWYTRGIDVWDVKDVICVYKFGPNRVAGVRFDTTGDYVAVRAERRSGIYHLAESKEVRIRGFPKYGNLRGTALRGRDNMMLVPLRGKGRVMKVTFSPLKPVRLPIDATVWTMRWSPQEDLLLVMDASGRVTCYPDVGCPQIWTMLLEGDDVSSTAAFCGNGSLIGVYANEAKRSIVLDAATGRIVRYVEREMPGRYPFDDTTVMTGGGYIVDLADGSVHEGCSNWRWWRAAGA